MQYAELEWKLCARTPLSTACTCGCAGTGVAESKGSNASTGAWQGGIFTFQ